MEHRNGVIHRAVRVHRHGEALLAEALPNLVGKTRAHEEYLLAGLYLEARLRYVYNRPKFHTPGRCNLYK